MLTDIQSIKQHTHDVEIIWEIWPFNVWTPLAIKSFLNGYGINWVMTYIYDITFWPRAFWNNEVHLFLSLGGILDIIPETLIGVIDFFTW